MKAVHGVGSTEDFLPPWGPALGRLCSSPERDSSLGIEKGGYVYGFLLVKAISAQVEVSVEESSFVMKAPCCYESLQGFE